MNLKNDLKINSENNLSIAGCDAVLLAKKYGTPLYVMNEELIRLRCKQLINAIKKYYNGNGRVMFASKAFMNKAICRLVYSEGLGVDVVSGGELYTALAAGLPGSYIELHGNNKTREELEMAIDAGLHRIIIDNFTEIGLIEEIAKEKGKKGIPVSIRLRPGIDAHTHQAIQTANLDCKFGISVHDGQAMDAAVYLINNDIFDFKGIHCHIGSQIFETSPYEILAEHFMSFANALREKTGYILADFNFGGGFGVWYTDEDAPKPLDEFIKKITDKVKALCAESDYPLPALCFEPGRCIVGEAGTTLYTVGGVKRLEGVRNYVSVDGGMYENPRCALYGAKYTAIAAQNTARPHDMTVAIAGKCCESGDIITWSTNLPADIKPGDVIAVLTTGAYNYSMASDYNRNGIPAVVLANNSKAELIVKRQSFEDLLRNDIIPEHLK